MKKWLVVAWDKYYPQPRLGNIAGAFYTEEEANEALPKIKEKYYYDFAILINIEDYINTKFGE